MNKFYLMSSIQNHVKISSQDAKSWNVEAVWHVEAFGKRISTIVKVKKESGFMYIRNFFGGKTYHSNFNAALAVALPAYESAMFQHDKSVVDNLKPLLKYFQGMGKMKVDFFVPVFKTTRRSVIVKNSTDLISHQLVNLNTTEKLPKTILVTSDFVRENDKKDFNFLKMEIALDLQIKKLEELWDGRISMEV